MGVVRVWGMGGRVDGRAGDSKREHRAAQQKRQSNPTNHSLPFYPGVTRVVLCNIHACVRAKGEIRSGKQREGGQGRRMETRQGRRGELSVALLWLLSARGACSTDSRSCQLHTTDTMSALSRSCSPAGGSCPAASLPVVAPKARHSLSRCPAAPLPYLGVALVGSWLVEAVRVAIGS